MTKKYVHEIEHAGHTVGIRADGVFETINEDGDVRTYESAKDARESIDARIARKAMQERKNLSLTVIDEDGKQRTITGLNAGHGKLIVKPAFGKYESKILYVATEPIRMSLACVEQLKNRARDIKSALEPFVIASSLKSYYRNGIPAEAHAKSLDDLEMAYAAAGTLASKIADEILSWSKGGEVAASKRAKKIKF